MAFIIKSKMSTDVDKRILRIPAFGCSNFELGTLYDASTDEIVPTGIGNNETKHVCTGG